MTPAWVRCQCCPEWFCTVHRMHAWVCDCPPVEDWPVSPYAEPAESTVDSPQWKAAGEIFGPVQILACQK